MQNQKINTFIFDCFGVILKPFIGGWHKDKRDKHGLVDENLESTLRKFDLGQLSEDELLDYFLKYDVVTLSKEELRDEIDSYLEIDHNLVRIIQELRKQDFKVALLSNANHVFFERKVFSTYPEFKSLFDEIVISSLVGMVKPEDDIYLHALQKLNIKPEEAIFIDDAEINVKAAVRLGIGGYVYTDAISFANYLKNIGIEVEQNKKPKIITDAGYEIYCDIVKLRELDLPIVDVEVDKLIWNFDLPLWEKDGTDDWNLTPWGVINKTEGSVVHQERVKQADLQFPILLLNKKGKWLIIDGVHRLVKAFQAKQRTIKAKIYTLELVEKYPR